MNVTSELSPTRPFENVVALSENHAFDGRVEMTSIRVDRSQLGGMNPCQLSLWVFASFACSASPGSWYLDKYESTLSPGDNLGLDSLAKDSHSYVSVTNSSKDALSPVDIRPTPGFVAGTMIAESVLPGSDVNAVGK